LPYQITIKHTQMETTNFNRNDSDKYRIGGNSKNSSLIIGAFIIIAGTLMLLRRIGLPIPHWLLGWEMLLIGIGLVMGFKSGFRDISWLFPIIIGTIFLSRDIFPFFRLSNLIWPLGIITIGVLIITKGNRSRFKNDFFPENSNPTPPGETYVSGFQKLDENGNPIAPPPPPPNPGSEDQIECTAVFGGVKRNVVSKNFMGGEIVAIFGGAEVDFTHADIHGVVKLEATNIFGGTKLIVPPTWDVQSEMVAIFGGVEDKRRINPEMINRNKRLVLMGTAFLGGLEIKSY
jgi:Cell wall-active antibiotics response 4TMS YvqF